MSTYNDFGTITMPTEEVIHDILSDPLPKNFPIMGLHPTENLTAAVKIFLDESKNEYIAMRLISLDAPSNKSGSQIGWVRKHFIPRFIRRYGAIPDKHVIENIARYMRNNYTPLECKTASIPSTLKRRGKSSGASTRAVSWGTMFIEEKEEEIQQALFELRKNKNNANPIIHYNKAKTDILNNATTDEIKKYMSLAEEENIRRKAPLTREKAFELQPTMIDQFLKTVRKRLGWEAGQYGDAVCFLSVTYRKRDNNLQTDCALISNHGIEPTDEAKNMFLSSYSEHMLSLNHDLSRNYIPENLPLLSLTFPELDFEETTAKELRNYFSKYLVAAWVLSTNEYQERTEDNMPWGELNTAEGRDCLLLKCEGFETLTSFDLEKWTFDEMREVALKIANIPNCFVFHSSRSEVEMQTVNQSSTPLPTSIEVPVVPTQPCSSSSEHEEPGNALPPATPDVSPQTTLISPSTTSNASADSGTNHILGTSKDQSNHRPIADDVNMILDTPTTNLVIDNEAEAPVLGKRKRGRPKKSQNAQPTPALTPAPTVSSVSQRKLRARPSKK